MVYLEIDSVGGAFNELTSEHTRNGLFIRPLLYTYYLIFIIKFFYDVIIQNQKALETQM